MQSQGPAHGRTTSGGVQGGVIRRHILRRSLSGVGRPGEGGAQGQAGAGRWVSPERICARGPWDQATGRGVAGGWEGAHCGWKPAWVWAHDGMCTWCVTGASRSLISPRISWNSPEAVSGRSPWKKTHTHSREDGSLGDRPRSHLQRPGGGRG